MAFLLFLLAGIGITNILVNATILDNPRNFIVQNSKFFGKLISCMMCTGFWIGFVLGIHAGLNPIYMGGAVSLLSYTLNEVMEYLQVLTALRASELSEVVDGEEDNE